jgi:hypothetical protein
MPLTRHLYAEDEVVAALQYCILRGRTIEAVFWCEELLYSEAVEPLFVGLRRIWLYGFGIGALSWFRAFCVAEAADEIDFELVVGLVIWLSRLGLKGRRDTTYLILCGSTAPAEQANFSIVPKGFAGTDAYFVACVDQGRCISAWRAFGSVARVTAERKHREAGLDACDLLTDYPAMLVAALCLPKGELAARLREEPLGSLVEIDRARADWPVGRRGRRKAIPHDCLYWATERGKKTVYETSEKSLRGSLERPGKLWDSPYWDSVADGLGGWEAIRSDPDVRMAFYDEYFPDDTPDEWSVADRELSHGRGALQPGAAPCGERFLFSWFGRLPSAVIWNGVSALKNMGGVGSWEDIPVPQPGGDLNLVRITRRLIIT